MESLESEKKYRHLFESSPFSVMLMDLRTRILEYNDATCILLGYSKEELIGKSRIEITANPSQIIPLLKRRFRKLLKGDPIGAFEHQLIRKDNKKVWVSSLSSLVQIKNRMLMISNRLNLHLLPHIYQFFARLYYPDLLLRSIDPLMP